MENDRADQLSSIQGSITPARIKLDNEETKKSPRRERCQSADPKITKTDQASELPSNAAEESKVGFGTEDKQLIMGTDQEQIE